MDDPGEELGGMTPVERAAHITMRLVQGETLTAKQVSTEYLVCRKAAADVLRKTSRVVPIYSAGGVWRAVSRPPHVRGETR